MIGHVTSSYLSPNARPLDRDGAGAGRPWAARGDRPRADARAGDRGQGRPSRCSSTPRERGSMAEPARTSPLAGLAARRAPVAGPAAGDAASPAVPRQADPARRRSDPAPAAASAGLRACRDRCAAARRAVWPSSGSVRTNGWSCCLQRMDEDQAAALLREARRLHHAVVVVSDRMSGIAVDGPRARDVLDAGCPLDLHPMRVPTGRRDPHAAGQGPRSSCAGRSRRRFRALGQWLVRALRLEVPGERRAASSATRLQPDARAAPAKPAQGLAACAHSAA